MAKRPRHLYHFTSHLWWRFIQDEGINRGECPISATRVLDFPNLTSDPEPANQDWDGKGFAPHNKLAVRLKVLVPFSDRKIVPWVEFARQNGAKGSWLAELRAAGGGPGCDKNWWVYRGTITPSQIVDVDILETEVGRMEATLILAAAGARTSAEARAIINRRVVVDGVPYTVLNEQSINEAVAANLGRFDLKTLLPTVATA
jgi:hypothetical protein